jgi:hypothetical protein
MRVLLLLILKFSGHEKKSNGWFFAFLHCPSDARYNSESMRRKMNRFEKGPLDLLMREVNQSFNYIYL